MGERPATHFTPRSGWLNDPLAVTWRDGVYHLFFQHVPASTTWAPHCQWGHAVSRDLLQWEERPVALTPADDEAGCWSGCLVPAARTDGDLLLYTSVVDEDLELGRVRLAHPRRTDPAADPWDAWVPGAVVVRAPEGAAAFRDPYVVRDGTGWRMLVGGGLVRTDPRSGRAEAAGTACVFGFASEDLATWTSTGLVASRASDDGEPPWTGTIWECPQLLRAGDTDVLVVSVCDARGGHHVAAAPGRLAGGRVTAAGSWQQLTHGVAYAPTGFTTADGRPALIAWLRDVADPAAGWAGALGSPLALAVEGDRVLLDLLVDPGGSSTWHPGSPAVVLQDRAGSPVAEVSAEGGAVVLTPFDGGPQLRLPRGTGPVRAIVDGPVVELFHDGRYGAVALLGSPV